MKIAHKLYLLVAGSALAYLTLQLLLLNLNEAELHLPQTMQALQNDLLVLTQRDHLFELDSSRGELRAGELAGLRVKLKMARAEIPASYRPLIDTVDADLKSREQMREQHLRYRNDFHEVEDSMQQASKELYQQARVCSGDSAFKLLVLTTRLNQAEAQDLLVDKDISKFDARASLLTNQIERWIVERTRGCSGGRRQAIDAEFVQLQAALTGLQDAGAQMDAYRLSADTLETRMTHDLGELRYGLDEYANHLHERLRTLSLLLPLIIMSIMVLVAVLLARSILRPLNQLVEYTRSLNRDEYSASAPLGGEDELGVLATTLGEMSRHLLSANQRLKEQIQFNETILLNSPIPIGVYQASGQCIFANDAYARLTGATRELLLAQNFNTITAWQGTGVIDDCRTALKYQVQKNQEINTVSSFGKEVWLEYRILPAILNGDAHLLMQFIDLTERKRLEDELRHTIKQQHAREEELRESEEKYRDLFDNANDLLYTTDLKGIFTSANNEMFKVLGYTKEELVGQPISKILRQSPLEIAREQMEAKINGVVPYTNYNLEVRACDGQMIPLELNSRLIYQGGTPTGIQGIARDVSEQLRREAELRTANQKAEEATRAKSRFLAAAGHDLRQPLAAANLFIGTLKFTQPSLNQSEIIGRLEGAMSDFNGLLNALLNISKLESGVIEPEYAPVAVGDMGLWLKKIATPMAEQSGIALRLHFPVKNLVVLSDLSLIKQVLSNLVSNAFKYTSKGTVLVSARLRGAEVLFQVWDTGIGIEEDQFEPIFDGFYQINNPQSDSANGLGLGLAIVKRSLELLGIEITCRSQPGRGSVFGFSLPLDENGQVAQSVSTPAHDEVQIATFARGKCFVVLENDRLVEQAISSFLEAMGAEVKLFHSAEDALHCTDIEKADCYICDYTLDGALSGLQFLKQLGTRSGMPVNALLMSGDTSPAFISAIKNCAWPVLSKPVNISSLIASLNGLAGNVSDCRSLH
jgi:PAS domain S-box-containing protein